MRFFVVVIISKKFEFESVFMDVDSYGILTKILPECPMIPLYLSIVLWGIRSITFVLYSKSGEKICESFSKLCSTICTDGLYTKGWRVYEIKNKFHTWTYTLFRVNSWEDKSTTVINRIVLNFLSTSSERKANIQLYFSSWSIEYVECFTSLSPFSLSLVANSRSWENSIDGWLVERNSCFFLKLPCKTSWSKCWISSCQTSYHFFHHSIRSVYWNTILWSTSFGNHSHFSLNAIASKPFTHTLTRYWKKRSYFVDFLLSIKNFLKKFYSHLQHRKTYISWSHGDRVIMIKGLNTSYHSISFFISFLSY